MNALRNIQDSISDGLDPEKQLMADVSCKKEDKNKKEYVDENSSTKGKLERQKQFYPDAFDFRKKGVFACLACFRRFTSCLKVKKHFIQQHPKTFCALGHEDAPEPRIQAKLLLFCPKNCQYVTLKMDAFTHHLATCVEPDFDSQDYVGNQIDFMFMAEDDDEDDGEDTQAKNPYILTPKTELCSRVTEQRKGQIYTCTRCNANFSASRFLECHMKLHHGEKSRKLKHGHKNFFHSYHQEKYQHVNTTSVRSRWQAEANTEGSSPDHCVPTWSRNDRVHKTFCEDGVLKHSTRLPLRPDVPSTSSGSISLDSNLNQIDPKSKFKCRDCGMKFSTTQNFHMHKVMHEKEKHADSTGNGNGKCRDGKEQVTSPARNVVSEQNKIYTANSQHLVLNRIPIFECVKCKKCFHQKKFLIMHMRSHGTKLHQCHENSKASKRSQCPSVHLKTHAGEKPWRCEECGASFHTNGILRMHLKRQHGDRTFQCTICGNCFRVRSTLQTHIRTHTGEKPYQCAECGKSFSQSGSLNVHMRIHTGEKPFKCELCGRAFMIRVVLKKHMRTHTKEKPFKCSECGKEYSNRSCFKWHLISHQKKSQD